MLPWKRGLFATTLAALSPSAAPAIERTVVGAGSAFTSSTADTSYYMPLGGVLSALNSTQAMGSHPWRVPGRLLNMYATCSANTRASSATSVTLQVAGVDQALTVSFPASTTTTQADTNAGHAVTLPGASELVGLHIRTGTGAGSITIRSVTMQFETDGQIATHLVFFGGSVSSALNVYYTPGGNGTQSTTEATSSVLKALEQFTVTNMFALVSASASSTASTALSQDNTADGTQTFSITAAATGLVGEDTTHSDTIAVDETLTIKKGSHTGNMTVIGGGFKAVWGTAKKTQINCVGNFGNLISGSTYYGGMLGQPPFATTESQASQKMPFAARFSKLCCYVVANASTVNATLTLRIAGSNTAVTVTITAGVTGFMTASASTADCAAADLISVSCAGQDANIQLGWVGMMIEDLT